MTEEKLKKEAWVYMVDHAILNETNKDVEQAYFDAAKPREEKIAALKKENEELKTNFKIAKDNEYEYQSLLTKATEIIKDLLLMAKVENLERNYESVDEAKQFLEEVKE